MIASMSRMTSADRPLAIALAEHDVGGAEVASPRTAARGLHGEPVVRADRRADRSAAREGARHRPAAKSAALKMRGGSPSRCRFDDGRPDVFAFADDHVIGMRGGFIRQNRHVQAAHGDAHAGRAQAIGDRVGLEHLRRERADRDEIAAVDVARLGAVGFGLEVSQLVPAGVHAAR